ncbi:MAG: DNA polymerase III subunit epsilon, partial [Alphaproteobacteria bacterium]|nr:DNA polymerase III subunit epsilon [Alphaproteobacteria bacterium]
ALARMDRFGIRHLPVADEGGLAAGVVSQRDLLHHRTSSALVLEDALHEAHTPAELAAAYSRVPQVAAQLVRNGLSGIDIAHVISTELREVSARAAELAVMAMKTAGRGEPPAPWCLFLLGSAGRGESLLGADQDNAIIHAGHDADDAWFAELGGHIADYLDEAGIPRCKGGVMAVNAEWRGSREAWRARVEKWLSRADPKDLLNVDIFFDLIPVAGTAPLADQLRAEAIRAAAQATAFLGLLAQETENLTPRLGLFGGLKTDNGRVEMKRQGLLPVVNFARMAALKIGSAAHATPDRLRDAVAAGRVAESDAEAMIETHALALGLILRQQIADLDAGVRPSNKVAAALMSKAERDRLKKGLSRIEGVIGSVRSLMAGR